MNNIFSNNFLVLIKKLIIKIKQLKFLFILLFTVIIIISCGRYDTEKGWQKTPDMKPVDFSLTGDYISMGEENLGKSYDDSIEKENLVQSCSNSIGQENLVQPSSNQIKKEAGIIEFCGAIADKSQERYLKATELFRDSYKNEFKKSVQGNIKDPETLIYLNNVFLEAKEIDSYTITVIAPITGKAQIRGEAILRGVAQLQTKVNLGVEIEGEDNLIKDIFDLEKIDLKNKGLKVILADDQNDKIKAQEIANTIVNDPNIIAVIGSYTSKNTIRIVDIFEDNKLVLMSSGATTKELTNNHRQYFFRTVPNVEDQAKAIKKFLQQNAIQNIAIFYNPSSPFSNSYKENLESNFHNPQEGRKVLLTEDISSPLVSAEIAINLVNGESQLAQGKIAIVLLPDGRLQNSASITKAKEIVEENNGQYLIVGAWTMYDAEILKLAKVEPNNTENLGSLENFYVAVPWEDTEHPGATFVKKGRLLWEAPIDSLTALSYDAALTLAKALTELESSNIEDITSARKELQQILTGDNFNVENGATGTIGFVKSDREDPPMTTVHIVAGSGNSVCFASIGIDRCSTTP